MDKNQMEMLSVKSAIERMVQNYISTYQATGSYKEFFTAVERLVASFFVGQQIDNSYLVRSIHAGRTLEIRFSTQGHCTRITFLLPDSLKWRTLDPSKEKPYNPPSMFDDFFFPGRYKNTNERPQLTEDKKLQDKAGYLIGSSTIGTVLLPGSSTIPRGSNDLPLPPWPELTIPKSYDDVIVDYNRVIDDVKQSTKPRDTGPRPLRCGDTCVDLVNYTVKLYNGTEWIDMNTDIQRAIAEANVRLRSDGLIEMFQNGKWVQMPRGTQKPFTAPDSIASSTTEDFDPFEAYDRAKKAVGNM